MSRKRVRTEIVSSMDEEEMERRVAVLLDRYGLSLKDIVIKYSVTNLDNGGVYHSALILWEE